jgi:hypothetical protein
MPPPFDPWPQAIESLAVNRWLTEGVDFALAAKGRLAPIAVVVMALLLKKVRERMGMAARKMRPDLLCTVCTAFQVIFSIVLDDYGEFVFNATCSSLLVVLCGFVLKEIAL